LLSADHELIELPLDRLVPHPLNANEMSAETFETLKRSIERYGYHALAVRPSGIANLYEILDGHQRERALRELGHTTARCLVWPCDDTTALALLASLNRLRGEDVPWKRANLIAELTELLPAAELALLLPESEEEIASLLSLLDVDSERLLADLTAAANRESATALRALTFALEPDSAERVEEALVLSMTSLRGPNRRGRALAAICEAYLERGDA
jgi:ParB family chromosome partitioning protein